MSADEPTRLTPERAALLGRIGGYSKWARTADRTAATAAARAGLLARFERDVRAQAASRGETLTDADVAKRAEALRLAQLARARLAGHDARRRRRHGG